MCSVRAGNSETCCGRVFIGGKALTEHFRKEHPKISKQGYTGPLEVIRNEKLKNFIFRKKKRIKQNKKTKQNVIK